MNREYETLLENNHEYDLVVMKPWSVSAIVSCVYVTITCINSSVRNRIVELSELIDIRVF